MDKFAEITISPNQTIFNAVEKITENRKQFVLVVNEGFQLLGMVTDGDIRRGILRGVSIDETIDKIMNPHPITSSRDEGRKNIVKKMRQNAIRHCPIIDADKKLLGVEYLEDYLAGPKINNWVVIMAGGLGKRLHPLTEHRPKPLVEVQGKPMLESIITDLCRHGFYKIFLAVSYKSEMIEEYFSDGRDYGADIHYIREDKRLGTAGPLSLLEDVPEEPVLVMNSDLVTDVNYEGLLHFHSDHKASATMCVRQYDFEVPYGVVETDHLQITDLREKPVQQFYINAGIYVLQPDVLKYIPRDTFYDMTDLFEELIKNDLQPHAFPVLEKWIDVGRLEDLEKADSADA